SEAQRRADAPAAMAQVLDELIEENSLAFAREERLSAFRTVETMADLRDVRIAFEVITEDFDAKRRLIAALETVLADDAIIASNTSAIPISLLQKGMANPARIIGVHWAEPAHLTRF